jgi:hypothetical protein
MNLPVDAIEFLDVFIGLFDDANPEIWKDEESKVDFKLPIIHVYGFTFRAELEQAEDYFVERISKALDFPGFNKSMIMKLHYIRDVSP